MAGQKKDIINIYIDTQVYLSYVNSATDIKSLVKLEKLIRAKRIELILPNQTKNEFYRHLQNRIEDCRDKVKNAVTPFKDPLEFLVEQRGKNKKTEESILKKISIVKVSLDKYRAQKSLKFEKRIARVDALTRRLFNISKLIEYGDDTVLRALVRYAKGLPPRKNDDKTGDAIIWETIIHNIKKGKLIVISKDNDFSDNKDNAVFNKILEKEWMDYTGEGVELYASLGEFLNTIDNVDPISDESINKEKAIILNKETMNVYMPAGSIANVQSGMFGASNAVFVNGANFLSEGIIFPNNGVRFDLKSPYSPPSSGNVMYENFDQIAYADGSTPFVNNGVDSSLNTFIQNPQGFSHDLIGNHNLNYAEPGKIFFTNPSPIDKFLTGRVDSFKVSDYVNQTVFNSSGIHAGTSQMCRLCHQYVVIVNADGLCGSCSSFWNNQSPTIIGY